MKIVIPGCPIAQPRPRIVSRFGRTFAFDPSSKKKEELRKFLMTQRIQMIGNKPLCVYISAQMRVPASLSAAKRKELNNSPHIKRPDIDNIAKFYLDLLQGIAYEKDENIFSLTAEKVYSTEPKVEINIVPVNYYRAKDHCVFLAPIYKIIDHLK